LALAMDAVASPHNHCGTNNRVNAPISPPKTPKAPPAPPFPPSGLRKSSKRS
jgi:hypothetical protein